jgi:hypothetical protein
VNIGGMRDVDCFLFIDPEFGKSIFFFKPLGSSYGSADSLARSAYCAYLRYRRMKYILKILFADPIYLV